MSQPPPPASNDREIEKMTFEEALAELDRIVKGLEGGQQKLEEAIVCYERGTLLRRHCESKLAQAEARVQAIMTAADGSPALRPEEAARSDEIPF